MAAPRRSRLRVSAGRWKGKALEIPAQARPTSSMAREGLFDILHDSVPGAAVLDLFAGSGAVGIEALSRGASRTVIMPVVEFGRSATRPVPESSCRSASSTEYRPRTALVRLALICLPLAMIWTPACFANAGIPRAAGCAGRSKFLI